MKAFSALFVVSFAAACGPEPELSAETCDLAAEHVESCIPGYLAPRVATCEGPALRESARMLDLECSEILTQKADGLADGVPALQGVRTRREGNLTYFMIPLANTWAGDRQDLLDQTVARFQTEMAKLNTDLQAHRLDASSVLSGSTANAFISGYGNVIENVLGSKSLPDAIRTEVGKQITAPESLTSWQRYLLPQAFAAYISTKFTVNVGTSVGVSATAMIVVQPWLTIAVDHTQAQPTIVKRSTEINVNVFGIPNVDIGLGVGGGLPLRLGVAAVFGPMNEMSDLSGWALGVSGSAAVPVLGGISGKILGVMRNPPLFIVMLAYSSGTAAELEVHGNFQRILNLGEFLDWLDTTVVGG